MGCVYSTDSGSRRTNPQTGSSSSSSGTPSISKLQLSPDLTSYQDACRSDPDLQSLDSSLQYRTSRVINSLAAGVEVRSLSLDSLREVTGSLLDMNQEVVNILIESKEDIWNNEELFSLVKDFFDLSILTLDFCTSLEDCLKNARYSLSFLQIAINQFDGDNDYLKTLEQFKRFEALEGPFSEEFFELFQSVYKQQLTMLKKLQIQKGKVDKKLKSAKTYRKLTNMIFVITFSTVLICSVVAAAVAAPPVVTALAAAAAVPLGSMGKWVNSLWKKYETELKGQREMISSMRMGNLIVIKDLDNIKALVDKLGIEMQGLVQNAQFAINEEEEEAVAMAVDEMKKTVNDFAKTIDELSDHSDKCCRDVRRARLVIVQKITKQPSGSI
ncbi:hypothetical protein L2E82_19081 [Cichorium intybus]|uniref:Uncharacterized protein n=1 Tax=Cichorium intybus TaxID=13427 RepID=A0ACB9FCR3_CICIN|nr:hypothetical protein L1887_36395 [Cichorium endivia]KAI3768417.1 hypothetical protein L2E82_19081 [Cichorium intybus]